MSNQMKNEKTRWIDRARNLTKSHWNFEININFCWYRYIRFNIRMWYFEIRFIQQSDRFSEIFSTNTTSKSVLWIKCVRFIVQMFSKICIRIIQISNFYHHTEFRQRFDLCISHYFNRIYSENICFVRFTIFDSISFVRRMFRSILVNDSISKTYETNRLFENDLQTLRAKFQFQEQISRAYSRTTYSEIEYQFEFSIFYIRIHVQNQEKINFVHFVCFVCFVDFFCNIYIDIWHNIIKMFAFLYCDTQYHIKIDEKTINQLFIYIFDFIFSNICIKTSEILFHYRWSDSHVSWKI